MPRDVMPIMSDRDLALAMSDRGVQPFDTPPVYQSDYTQHIAENKGQLIQDSLNLHQLYGTDTTTPTGQVIEKYLPPAAEVISDYTNELTQEHPSFRIPSGQYDQYIEPADPGSKHSGNIMGRRSPEGVYIDGVEQAYLDFEDLTELYPEMKNIRVENDDGTSRPLQAEDLAVKSIRGDYEHYFIPDRLLGLYNSLSRKGIQDLVRYNLEGERYITKWGTEEHERLHQTGQQLIDNASLWKDDILVEIPGQTKKVNLFDLMTIKDEGLGPNIPKGMPTWDRELMHIAIYRMDPESRSRERITGPSYSEHRVFDQINKMNVSEEENALRKMDLAANLVKALDEAAGIILMQSYSGNFKYGEGYEDVWGNYAKTTHAQKDHNHGAPPQGIIGRK